MRYREYMVVFEKGTDNWSVFSLDVPGCGSLGDDLEEARVNVREAIELYLAESAKAGESLPEPSATTVDFEQFDSDYRSKQYFIEWIPVAMPQSATRAAWARMERTAGPSTSSAEADCAQDDSALMNEAFAQDDSRSEER